MNSLDRRNYIERILLENDKPKKGQELAEELGVTRQVIVKDIAILRAKGKNIIATPDGYLITKEKSNFKKKVLALSHNANEIEDELKTIVRYGGIVQDVIIEHSVYGELKGMLMLKTIYDVENFISKFNKYNAEPLLVLTNGIHLHTILFEKEDDINKIVIELRNKGYLIEE